MRLPAGVVKKRESYFARIHTKGGEKSFPLGPDVSAAVALFYRVKADVLAGIDPRAPKEPTPAELTVATAVDRWYSEKVDTLKRAEDTKSVVERFLLPLLGKRTLASIRRADCHAYLASVRRANPDYKAATIRLYARTLRELLNWCVDVELLDSTPWPTKRGFLPTPEKAAPDRLTEEEVATLVALPEPWGFHMRLALSTGLRWGELVRLERTDLTPDGQILIRRAKDREYRTVPVPRALLAEIVARKGRLFVTREGKPYSEKGKGYAATIQRKTGIDRFHPHMTRHTFACRYLEADGVIVALQEILGHSSLRMTQKYGRPNERAIRADAARVFEAWDTPNREQNREHAEIRPFQASGEKC
ncbi:MAG: tyrosine-type recombinase/integrase [Candidatus Eisenbacteria bacterium]